ncbi:zinc finger, CCHC-type containing protein [Tanacetum coccineum]|uniref:Zinc finger, CCHC-type containing protein n=1 Tax=Tanacetum coccineum TaxID=301880 RepID=A0ABQ5H903_9ASTR
METKQVMEKIETLENNLNKGLSVAVDQLNSLLRECRRNQSHYLVVRLHNIINSGTIHPDNTTMEELISAFVERKEVLEENDFEPGLKNNLVASYVENRWIQNALSSYHEIKQEKDTPGVMTTTKILQNIYYRSDQIYLKELSDLESSSKNYNEWDEGCTAICYFYLALYLHGEEVELLAGNLHVREEGNLQPGSHTIRQARLRTAWLGIFYMCILMFMVDWLVIVLASALSFSVEAILVRLFAISEEYGQYREEVADEVQIPSKSNPSEEVSSAGYLIRGCFSIEPSAGVDFRRWQKNMHLLIFIMSVVYVLTAPMLEDGGENPTVDQVRKRAKWDNDDYVCRGLILNGMSDSLFDVYQDVETSKELWDTLEAKYIAEDASSKKFLVSNFTNYKMTYSRPVLEQYNELLGILGRFTQHKMNMDESIQVSCIIDKLPPSWKDFKHTLKHLKEELTLIELGSHLRIEKSLRAQDNDKPKGNNAAGPSVVNMVEHNNSSRYNDNKGKHKHHDNRANPNKKPKVTCWKCGKPGHLKKDCKASNVGNRANGSGIKGSEDDSSNPLKDRCWFMTYESLNDGSIIHMGNESTALVHGCGCVDLRFCYVYLLHTKDEALDKFKVFKNKVELQQGSLIKRFRTDRGGSGTKDEVSDQHSFCFNVEDDPKTFDEAMKSHDVANLWVANGSSKESRSKFDAYGKGVIICLYVNDMLIFGTDQVQVDLTKEFLSSRFSMKDIGEADFILSIRIKHESNGITISQSHYIEKFF